MSTRVIEAGTDTESAVAAGQAAAALKAGLLVGFATETVYGVGAVATNAAAVERLRLLKSRPERPFSVHLSKPADAGLYVRDIPSEARRLIAKAWPGPVTLLLPTGGQLAETRPGDAGLRDVLCDEGIIGLRCPDSTVARLMLAAVEEPVIAPSANPAAAPSPRTAREVLASLDGQIDLLIDSGPTRYGIDSTIVRFDRTGWQIVRQGAYDTRTIHRLLLRTYLFVCTGNTCRSPIAAGLARKMLAEQLGCSLGQLDRKGVAVLSAGIFAAEGERARPEAIAAAGDLGVDIRHHRGQKLTFELISLADLVFCMTDFHVAEALRLVPSAAGKVQRLRADADIPDPIGGGAQTYRRTARQIEDALKTLFKSNEELS